LTTYPDYICYRRDGKGNLYREEAVLHANSDGESIKTIAQSLYDGDDDGDTVQVFRLDRQNPASSADVTAEVVSTMEAIHVADWKRDEDGWLHPLIAAFAERHFHDENIAAGLDRDPRTGQRYRRVA